MAHVFYADRINVVQHSPHDDILVLGGTDCFDIDVKVGYYCWINNKSYVVTSIEKRDFMYVIIMENVNDPTDIAVNIVTLKIPHVQN